MSDQTTRSKHKSSTIKSLLGGGRAIWALAIGLALVAMFAALTILGNVAATQTYYILGGDLPARTQVTPEMLVPAEAKVGQAPPNAFDPVYVRDNDVFTKYALAAGDVVSPSNAGPLTRITENVPDNFVAASFTAEPELVVAGKVRAGDHIDLIANTNDDGAAGATARVVLQHVLVLDVTVSPSTIAEEATEGQAGEGVEQPGPESQAARSGIPSVYTVALSPADATKLALIRNLDLFVVLSGNVPDFTADVQAQMGTLFSEPVADSSAGTFDSVFIRRWDVAFEPGNVYVDNGGNFWQVNTDRQWTEPKSGTVLDPEDTPPGYLPIPEGSEFTDAEGTYWLAVTDNEQVVFEGTSLENYGAQWVAPADKGKQTALEYGDNPTGYDPRAEFDLPETAPSN